MSLEIVKGLTLFERKDWGADETLPRLGNKVPRRKRNHVIFHHTVMTDNSDTSPNLWETRGEIFDMMKKLQVVRRDDLGADVPYNFVAFFNAKTKGVDICEGRGEDRSGAHTYGHNTNGIGISLAGNFHEDTTDIVEIASRIYLLSFFLGWLRYNASGEGYGNFSPMRNLDEMRPTEREVYAHRDFKATACPGKFFEPHLRQITFLKPPT